MKKVVTNYEYQVNVEEAVNIFETGRCIIAGIEEHGLIFKLTVVKRSPVRGNKYAMVSLDGRAFWNGIYDDKRNLLKQFEGKVYMFDNAPEYAEWLREVL